MNNHFKNSIIKATRPGIIDVWNVFMVEGANFTQNDHDIPFSPTTATKLPTSIVDWVEARHIYKAAIASGNKNFHYDAFVCFYVDDYRFDRPTAELGTGDNIWTDYKYVLKVLRHFEGTITPDFSICQDFPEPVKTYNIYRMRAYGYWLCKQGIAVINNCRWGSVETYAYVWDGLPSDDILCIGTVGGSPRKLVDRTRFEDGLQETVLRKSPKILLTYGSAKYPCFETLCKKGIEIISYPSRTARVFEKGASV